MPEFKEVLDGVLAALYPTANEGVAALYNADGVLVDDALDKIKALEEARVANFRANADKAKQEQFQYGERKAHEAWEKTIKAHGVKSDKRGVELIDELLAVKGGKTELTEDVVKTTPVYRTLESRLQAMEQDFETKMTEAKNAWTAESQRNQTLGEIYEHAMVKAEAMKVAGLPKDPAKRKAFLTPVFNRLGGHQYQVQEDNGRRSFLPLKADGGRLEDKLGHQIPLEKLIEGVIGETYELETGDGRSNHQNGNSKANGASAASVPTDPDELAKFVFDLQADPSIPADKKKAVLDSIAARK